MFCSYKPVKLSALIEPLKLDFEALVRETFSNLDNKKFLENVEVSIVCQQVLLCGYLLVKQGKVSIFGVLGDFVETLQKSFWRKQLHYSAVYSLFAFHSVHIMVNSVSIDQFLLTGSTERYTVLINF